MGLDKTKPARPFVIEAGDEIVTNSSLGYLVLIKTSGEVIDLNEIVMANGSTDQCITATQNLGILGFLQLASVLAASYGLASNTVSFTALGLVASMRVPHIQEGGFGVKPSNRAMSFMTNPQVPSLKSTVN